MSFKKLFTLSISLFLISFNSYAAGPGGSGTRGGGDSTAAEFLDLARQFFSVLESSATISNSQKFHEMKSAFTKTQVFLSLDSKLDLDGVAVTAINIPEESKIILSESSWKNLTEKEKIRLIAHEFLGLAKEDDSQYFSSNIMTMEYFYLLRLDLRELNKGSYFVVNQDIEFAIGELGARIFLTEMGSSRFFPRQGNYCTIKMETLKPQESPVYLLKGTVLNIELTGEHTGLYSADISFWLERSKQLPSISIYCYNEDNQNKSPFNNVLYLNNYLRGLLTLKVGLQ